MASRADEALPLVIPLCSTNTEALLRAGENRLAQEDAQRWDALVANVPRLRLSHLASLVVLAERAGDMAAAKAANVRRRSAGIGRAHACIATQMTSAENTARLP